MDEQTFSTSKRVGVMALATVLLLLSLFLGMERLTARAESLQQAAPEFTIFKTVSHESATQGMSVTFTIDVYNVGDETGSIHGRDVLPQEMEEPTIIMADGTMTTAVEANELRFGIRSLPPGQGARLVYQTKIRPEAECGQELVNHARLMVYNDPIGEPAEARLRVVCSDLGDAPASDNHFLTPMNLPDGTQAKYPTVYNPPLGAPSGPLHRRADLMHLGEMVSFERQADIGPDSDLINNILPPFDAPDLDGYDDGLMNWDSLHFAHCEPATLQLLVYIDPAIASNLDRAFINVWFDGNRDGDWADVNLCDNLDMPHVPEHIVIDYAVPPTAGFQTVTLNTTFPVFNAKPDEPGWLRVTLSEQPSVKIGIVDSWMFGDGRGVFSTLVDPAAEEEIAGFMFGETEDYFFRPQTPPEPGPVIIKTIDPAQAALGGTLRFQIQVSNTHTSSRFVTVVDPIPDGTTYVQGTLDSNLQGLASGYDAGSETAYWRGAIPPGELLTFWFSVRVVRCDPHGFVVLNRAWAFEPGSRPSKAEARAYIDECVDVPLRQIRVHKWASQEAVPGGKVEFTLAAHSAELQTSAVVVDPLHFGLEVDQSTLPPSVEFYPPNLIVWQTDIVPNEVMSVTFKARVREWACREGDIFNQAYWWSEIGLDGHSNPTWTDLICSDLGDAPDSTFNHHGMTNTAYSLAGSVVISPLVPGLYPTVRDTAFTPGEPNGPFHHDATAAWLGKGVSFEGEADTGPDSDGLNNILAFGLDNSDNDGWDDGWLNPHTPLPDCKSATLKVRVTKNSAAVSEMWLNVWFDGNRDGDWEDWKFCGNDQRKAFEWIVPNYLVDMSTWPVGASHDIVVHTFLVMNDRPDEPAWMRFTLSERQPPRNPATGLADGRGPGYWYPYRWGETEDYQAPGIPQGEPGEVSLDKTASAASVGIGQVYTYSVYLTHSGGSGPAHVVMTDVLPAEVVLAGGPTVVELNPSAVPLVAYFDSSVGPNGAVGWWGMLSPDAAIRIDFPVKVRHCPTNDARVIVNEAHAKLMGGDPIPPASTETHVDCEPPPAPDIELHKSIVTDAGEQVNEWHTVPGEHVVYRLVLESATQFTYTVHISDPMPSGVIAIAADATSGVAHVIQGGRAVVWNGKIGPANTPVIVRIRAKLREVRCDSVVRNQAYWFTPFFPGGESNVVWFRLVCHDLGDAPDSSNHFNTTMTTYPSVVTATFPTVFTGTTPLLPHGPLHLFPHPLHLGPRVSFEVEADLGMDLDGVNNIVPRLNKSNLDKADDGLKMNTLHFTHCEYKRIPVWVSIAPSVIPPTGEERLAYINMWVDGLRDGDWDDVIECPPPAGSNDPVLAPEHIVIDHAINLTALGPGLHLIYVTTTGPVPWPADLSGPAWLRVTLSERKSNKTLPVGCGAASACTYGDGRGYADPFELGETEDYLLRGPGEPDPAIEKYGFIHPWFDFDDEQRVWFVGWPVRYKNVGDETSTDVQVIDTLGGDQELVRVRSYPYISPTINGSTLTFDVGTLPPGKRGYIFVHTSVPFTAIPGTVLTNTVVISSEGDSDLTNNSQTVTLTVPLLPPRITYPRPGTTCTGIFTITGHVQLPGATVEVFIDHTPVASVTADALGRWFHPVNLPDGIYYIQARAVYGSSTSPLSPPVKVIVDSSLVWSPLSLRFISEHGHVVIPKDEDGRTDEDGWFVFLRPGVTYTVTVYSCCSVPNTFITLELPGLEVVLEDLDGDGWFEATFTMPEATLILPGSVVRLCVVCDNIEYCYEGEILIDPEGVVFDVTQGQESGLLQDAVVACYEGQTDLDSGETTYGLWDAESYGGQVNPQTTASDGYFSFYTPAGVFQLDVDRDSYQPYQSWDLVVVDEPVEFNIPLTPDIAETADYVITIDESGFVSPVLTVEPGAVIEWINVGNDYHTATSVTPTARIEGLGLFAPTYTDGWDSGLLSSGESYKRQLNTAGNYYYYDYENTSYTGLIVVEGEYSLFLPLVLKSN